MVSLAADDQMLLFKDLPIPAAPVVAEVARVARPRLRRAKPVQLALPLIQRLMGREPIPGDYDDEDDAFDYPVHVLGSAASMPGPAVRAPASVFDLVARPVRIRLDSEPSTSARRIERDGGVTRLTRIQPQDTEEWQERERIRRAKQRPPKPPKGAKTRSRKLLDIIGANTHDDDEA